MEAYELFLSEDGYASDEEDTEFFNGMGKRLKKAS